MWPERSISGLLRSENGIILSMIVLWLCNYELVHYCWSVSVRLLECIHTGIAPSSVINNAVKNRHLHQVFASPQMLIFDAVVDICQNFGDAHPKGVITPLLTLQAFWSHADNPTCSVTHGYVVSEQNISSWTAHWNGWTSQMYDRGVISYVHYSFSKGRQIVIGTV